ncbi:MULTISPECIES: Rrf2 family transcriptional regulator [unclassified Prosthecochloris]|uniref:RrF2 family transcriptional regulator n=1 Tax=unclassified Prosthecochloris TaxID=2632826 RepID=UPI00223DD720|nr:MULTISPECIES: Rrf2 family transcriptional regulator [unclassified Prosthecochloris]UZJ38964.1 Rrf2 family transcriptional regulator [Prosthecochloris sp. SCSIO W1102]
MRVLTKNTDYAVRALLVLGAHEGEYVSARKISEEQGIPYQFLRRILQDLCRHGLVHAKEGAHGGVMLDREPESIRIKEVIEIFQGKIELSECMFRKQLCSNRANCVLRHEILRIEQMVNREFEGITIGKLLDDLKALDDGKISGKSFVSVDNKIQET